jgi:hypothetical protein
MPKSKAEIMAALREKRIRLGLVEIRVWIKKRDLTKVKKLLEKYRQ